MTRRMEKLDPKADGATPDVAQQNIEKLKALFPDVFTEGKVDFDALRETLGDYIEDKEERYSLAWNGKARARRIAQTPSTGTLRPCPEESVNWDSTRNLFIEGDNLEVLKLLQKSYHCRVKMIYIDPPYNTGKEFIYPDKFRSNLDTYFRYTGQIDDDGFKVSANTEKSGRYHTNWLNMMYPRLKLARNLLRDDGVIFVSIDENENTNLRYLCNEVFGEESFLCEFIWKKKSGGGNDTDAIVIDHEYVLAYGKTSTPTLLDDPHAEVTTSYNREDEHGRRYSLDRLDKQSIRYTKSLDYPITGPDGTKYWPQHKDPKHPNATWRWGRETVKSRYDELVFENGCVYTRNYEKDGAKARTLLTSDRFGRSRTGKTDLFAVFNQKVMDHPKPLKLMSFLLDIACDDGDIVLDYFAGSATLGHAVLQHEKSIRAVLIQLPEPCDGSTEAGRNALSLGLKTIADIGRDRLRRVSVPESGMLGSSNNRGFRFFTLDTSNIKLWDAEFDRFEDAIYAAENSIKEGRSQNDVLYELLLKFGLDLCVPIEERKIAGKTAFSVGTGALVVCLDEEITIDVVEGIAGIKEELQPEVMRVVFRDSGFKDDVVKTNAVQILKQAGLSNEHIRSI